MSLSQVLRLDRKLIIRFLLQSLLEGLDWKELMTENC